MNTDQQELAAYQRAVESAKNELAVLRHRAEQAEADAANLRRACDRMVGIVRGVMEAQNEVCPLCHVQVASFGDRHAVDCPMAITADHPDTTLLKELEAARLALEEIRARPKMPSGRLLEAIFADYDAAVKASKG